MSSAATRRHTASPTPSKPRRAASAASPSREAAGASKDSKDAGAVKELQGRLRELESKGKAEERVKAKEAKQRQKDLVDAKKRINKELQQASQSVKKGEREVAKLATAVNKAEGQSDKVRLQKAKELARIEDSLSKMGAKRNNLESVLHEKVSIVGEARGKLAHLQFAAKMIDTGVIVETGSAAAPGSTDASCAAYATDAQDLMVGGKGSVATGTAADVCELKEENERLRYLLQEAERQLSRFGSTPVMESMPPCVQTGNEAESNFEDSVLWSPPATSAVASASHCPSTPSAEVAVSEGEGSLEALIQLQESGELQGHTSEDDLRGTRPEGGASALLDAALLDTPGRSPARVSEWTSAVLKCRSAVELGAADAVQQGLAAAVHEHGPTSEQHRTPERVDNNTHQQQNPTSTERSVASANAVTDATKRRAASAHLVASHAPISSSIGTPLHALPTRPGGFAWASRAGAVGTPVAARATAGSNPTVRNLTTVEPVASPQLRSVPRDGAVEPVASPEFRSMPDTVVQPTVLRFQTSPSGKPLQQPMPTLLVGGGPSAGMMFDVKAMRQTSVVLPLPKAGS